MKGQPLLSYSYLAKRWGWSKSRVGRFILKIEEAGIISRVSFSSSRGSVISPCRYRNDLQGTIICTSDGESVSFSTEKNESAQTNPTVTAMPEPNDVGEYIGNKNSKKFHLPTCKNLPAEKNRVFFDSRQEAVNAGFDPCGNCQP